ncbi:hypothetical protein dsx2_2459 [Desulfovibrio sp. X2]|uniref:GNAT family N-acetyltransferase n=1 Tax=Desulfovibrio sp. X2 TaxID=941449 RepID=UPI0003589E7B|nr:GNAT family N-acetyltransferase [Desulfovibrio sp. X2]EPR43099.1 hypothetical protein dsx2_2459 [Desulfovibrio sp. X2]
MTEVTRHERMADVGPLAWDACLPGELEDHACYQATESSGLPGFSLFYLAVREGGEVLAVAPAFVTDYSLDTTVRGPWKRPASALVRLFPRLLRLRLACLGSPVAERCHLGFAPSVAAGDRPALAALLFEGLETLARGQGARLTAAKDVADNDLPLLSGALARGYHRLPSLPGASLPLPFPDLEAYLSSLGRATRKNMRRRLRAAQGRVTVERREAIDDVLPEIAALYEETLARSDMQFERLPAAWFREMLSRMPGRASCVLYRVDGRLAAFNLVLENRHALLDKFFGMRADLGREHGLYFVSWLENVRRCIERGLPVYVSGQAGYEAKLRLGSRLAPNWLLFRHGNPVLNGLLRLVAAFARPDNFDPAIRGLGRALGQPSGKEDA